MSSLGDLFWLLLGRMPDERRKPTLWMEAESHEPLDPSLFVPREEECPGCPFVCPECGSDLTEYIHDGWECLECGVVY